MNQRTMADIHYGIQNPKDLLDKLLQDASKLSKLPDKYDLFNFVVTAAVLSEWICKFYKKVMPEDVLSAMNGESETGLPIDAEDWIDDKSCLPNPAQGACRHICNAMRICWGTANASKHYYWQKSSGVQSIGAEPGINDFYSYFNTAVGAGIFINYNGEYYTVEQVKEILVQFYPSFIEYLDALQEGHENAP